MVSSSWLCGSQAMNANTEYTIEGRTGIERTTDERKAYAASKAGATVTAKVKA